MNVDILDIGADIDFETSVTGVEYRTHEAFTGSKFDKNDEIRISIQNQDSYTLPSESYIYLEGMLTQSDNSAVARTKLINNAIAHLFEQVRYLINGVEIDNSRNVGITSFIKGISSFNKGDLRRYGNSGWSETATYEILDAVGNFNAILPLRLIMGFFEDYRKVLLNCKQELVLLRRQNDFNSILTTPGANDIVETTKINIKKINWRVPYIEVSDSARLQLLKVLQDDKPIFMGFRSWQTFEKPLLTTTEKMDWQVQTSTILEKPRFILFAFQEKNKNDATKDINKFVHASLRNFKLYLNGKGFPYDNLNLSMTQNRYAVLYEMYAKVRESYYGKDCDPLLSYSEFKDNSPFVIIDCSKQNEAVKSGSVDVRIEFEADAAFADGTTAYCILIHERIIEYTPLTNIVRKLV
jgi:hypothetical protein